MDGGSKPAWIQANITYTNKLIHLRIENYET